MAVGSAGIRVQGCEDAAWNTQPLCQAKKMGIFLLNFTLKGEFPSSPADFQPLKGGGRGHGDRFPCPEQRSERSLSIQVLLGMSLGVQAPLLT